MKRLLTVLALTAAFGISPAKAELSDCEATLSVYYEFYKNKNYADAYKGWSFAFRNCKEVSKSIYIHGTRIMDFKIKEATDKAAKEAYIDTLMMIYDQRLKYFPGKEGFVIGQKGIDVYKYRRDQLDTAFHLLEQSVELDGKEASSAVLTYYFQVAIKLFEKEKLDKERMIGIYEKASAAIAYNIENIENEKKRSYYEKASENMETLFAPVASCEDLAELYEMRFTEHKDDQDWLAGATKMLDKKDCSGLPIYNKLATRSYELNPSAPAAAALARTALSKNDYSGAISYFRKAIELSESQDDKAASYYGIAAVQYKLKQYASAKASALSAANARPNWGEPYLLIGNMYAEDAGKCGSNDFERKAVYWAAIEKFQYAKKIDSSVADKANKAIAAYEARTPDKTLAFQYGYLDKKTYKVECWINETVNIPSF